MIRDFKTFGGRSVILSLVVMLIFVIVFMGAGLFFNYSFPEASDDNTSVSDEMFDTLEEEKSSSLDIIIPNFMLGYLSFFIGCGSIMNCCYKIDGSKWVRTVKNSKKRFINAYNFTLIINLAFIFLLSTVFYLCFLIHSILNSDAGLMAEHYPPIWTGYITAVGGALLSGGICSMVMHIKKANVRLLAMIISVALAAFVIILPPLLFEITGNDNLFNLFPLILLLAGAVVFAISYVIFIRTVKKRWLFE